MTFHCRFSASRAGDDSTQEKEVYGNWIIGLLFSSLVLAISLVMSSSCHKKTLANHQEVYEKKLAKKDATMDILIKEKGNLEEQVEDIKSERNMYKAKAETEKGKLFRKDLLTFIEKLYTFSKKNYRAGNLAIYLEGRKSHIETKTDDSVELMRKIQEEYNTNKELSKKVNYWSSRLYPTFITYLTPLQDTQTEQEKEEKRNKKVKTTK